MLKKPSRSLAMEVLFSALLGKWLESQCLVVVGTVFTVISVESCITAVDLSPGPGKPQRAAQINGRTGKAGSEVDELDQL